MPQHHQCLNCQFYTNVDADIIKHQYQHKHSKNNRFLCIFCGNLFNKYNNFIVHISRFHNKSNDNIESENKIVVHCLEKNCNFSTNFQSKLLNHLCDHLKSPMYTSIQCPYGQCHGKSFNVITSLRSHFNRSHPLSSTVQSTESTMVNENVSSKSGAMLFNDEQSDNSNVTYNDFNLLLEKLLLMLKAKYFVPEEATEIIFEYIANLLTVHKDFIYNNILKICAKQNINNPAEFKCVFPEINFNNYTSSYRRLHFLKSKFEYVQPTKVILGNDSLGNEMFYYYVPVLETLKNCFQNKYFKNEFFNRNISDSYLNVYDDYTDGTVYKSNLFFNSVSRKLEIILYIDGFDPSNSGKGKHKLTAVYMAVGNLHPFYRTKQANIHLVLLCLDKYIKIVGINKIFEKCIHDLKILETDGIEVTNLTNEIMNVQGTVYCVCSDNLGAHQIGGFNENFSTSKYLCRFCFFTKNDVDAGDLSIKEERTPENYNQALIDLQGSNGRFVNGIKFDSIFNSLKEYHVCNPGLPPCLSHNLFEGVVQNDFISIINYYVKTKKVISYETLNSKYSAIVRVLGCNINFPYITRNSKVLPGTSYEKWYFVIIFPFVMMDENIDRADIVWESFLNLLEICRIMTSFKISDYQKEMLNNAIDNYYQYRSVAFPETHMKPKDHYVMHSANFIEKFGPPIRLWTMPFEHNHQKLKQSIVKSRNYINATKLCSERYQLNQILLNSERFPMKIYSDESIVISEDMFNFSLPKNMSHVSKSIQIFNEAYKENDYVITSINNDYEIKVVQILFIFFDKSFEEIYFYGKSSNFWFNYTTGLYENFTMFHSSEADFFNFKTVLSIEPVKIFKKNYKQYISLPSSLYFSSGEI